MKGFNKGEVHRVSVAKHQGITHGNVVGANTIDTFLMRLGKFMDSEVRFPGAALHRATGLIQTPFVLILH